MWLKFYFVQTPAVATAAAKKNSKIFLKAKANNKAASQTLFIHPVYLGLLDFSFLLYVMK